MVDLDDLRACAIRLPEVEEKPHFGRPAFRVRDRLFASVHAGEDAPFAILHVDQSDAAAAVAATPGVIEEVWRTHGTRRIFVGVRVDLASLDAKTCEKLVSQAWRNVAPKRLAPTYVDRP